SRAPFTIVRIPGFRVSIFLGCFSLSGDTSIVSLLSPCISRGDNFAKRSLHGGCVVFPFAAAVEHLANASAHVTRALGIGVQSARNIGMAQRLLDTQENGLGGEQLFLHLHSFGKGIEAS